MTVQSVLMDLFGCFLKRELSSNKAAFLKGATFWMFLKIEDRTFFSIHFVKFQIAQPYNSTDTATAWKISCFILK